MTQEEIIKGNKLIAEFMGYTETIVINIGDWNTPALSNYIRPDKQIIRVCNPNDDHDWKEVDRLKYHSSWDWLMPVVEKIEGLNHQVLIYEDYACIATQNDWFYCNPEILGDRYLDKSRFEICLQTSNKKANVWSAVIEFIKWYNTQNQ